MAAARGLILAAALALLAARPLHAAATLAVSAVEARPARLLPSGRALVHLRVRLRNLSPRTLDGFGFQVEVDGEALPVYRKTLFFGYALPPGREDTVALYNFWVRGAGRHTVRVRLLEAYAVSRQAGKTHLDERVPLSVQADRAFTVR